MSLVPTQRKRTSTPRSRTGCLTCRQRRIKCDEQRPRCQNCSRRKLNCELPLEAADPHDLARTLLISSYTLPFSVPGSANDRRALHYYFARNQSYHSLGCSASFWCTLVPQRCQHESVLRHTLVAFSRALLYQSVIEECDEVGSSETFNDALETNGRAIRALRRYIDRSIIPDPVVILACCILLVSVSQLLDLPDAALLHLDHAITLFNSWHGQNLDLMPTKDRRIMHTMLGAMDALMFVQRPSYLPQVTLKTYIRPKLCATDLTPRLSFDTLDDVYCHGLLTSFLPITHFLARHPDLRQKLYEDLPQSILGEQRTLTQTAKQWDMAAHAFEREHYHDNPTSSDPATLLKHMGIITSQAHNIIAECLLTEAVPQRAPSPPAWDQNTARLFELARRYCVLKTQLYATDKHGIDLGGWKPNSVHIKQCLDMIAEKTTRADIRATALELGQETAL